MCGVGKIRVEMRRGMKVCAAVAAYQDDDGHKHQIESVGT